LSNREKLGACIASPSSVVESKGLAFAFVRSSIATMRTKNESFSKTKQLELWRPLTTYKSS